MQPTARTSGDMPDIIEKLTDATGLSWNPPPEIPSLLRNGYYTEIPWTRAPHLARHLRDVAVTATGRSRAIVYERCGRRDASINIPKELAENQAFLLALANKQDTSKILAKRCLAPTKSQPLTI